VPSIPMDSQQLLDFLTDDETSLFAKPFFALRLEEEFKKSWRYGWSYGFVVFEVEGLDRIRADEGEASHRSAVLDIAGEILSASRDIDLSARLSDGRFAILLPGTDAAGVQSFVDRVLGSIESGGFGRLTLHAGATVSPGDELGTVDEFIGRAETGLAMAREQGGGRLVVWTSPAR